MTKFQLHVQRWKDCMLCELGAVRRNIVLSRGDIPCDVLFIGEAPGESEDLLGIPFVGPAGKLLDKILLDANLNYYGNYRVAMTNLVACYPREQKEAGTNAPPRECIHACAPRLAEFICLCDPKMIVRVGSLVKTHLSHSFQMSPDIKVVDIIHPAFILSKMPIAFQYTARREAAVKISTAWRTICHQND